MTPHSNWDDACSVLGNGVSPMVPCLFSFISLKFMLTIENFIIVLSFTNILTLILIYFDF